MRFFRPLSKILFVGCILGATLSAAFAQDGARQGRGGGGGGGGGQGPGGRGGMRMGGMGGGGLVSLLRMEEVLKELKADEDQTTELKTIQDEMFAEIRTMFPAPQPGTPPSQPSEEDRKKNEAKMLELQVKVESKLEEILDPKQMDRLLGLLIQRDGVRSLNTPILATRLKITEEQKAKIGEIEKAGGEAMRSLFSAGRGPEAMEKMIAMRKENEEKIQTILTAEQKSAMESMKGEEFKFPSFGPPGGGRGGNRNPGA